MAIKSILTPQGSVTAGIATGVLVYAVYDRSLPSAAVIHATDAHDINIEAARKKASWTSAAVVAAVSLLTRDHNVFILGGVVLVALDFHTRHANAVNPETGMLDESPSAGYHGTKAQGYAVKSGPGRLSVVS